MAAISNRQTVTRFAREAHTSRHEQPERPPLVVEPYRRSELRRSVAREKKLQALVAQTEQRFHELPSGWLATAIDKVIECRDKPVHECDMVTRHRPTTRNLVRPLVESDVATRGLFPDLRAATSSIHILSLEYEPGALSDALTDLLLQKHADGVAVRIVIDWVGSRQFKESHRRNVQRLRDAGISVITQPSVKWGLEHRKTFLVDGKIGYVGGWCLRDESVYSATRKHGARVEARAQPGVLPTPSHEPAEFHDYNLRIEGDAVRQLQVDFCMTWRWHGGALDPDLPADAFKKKYFPLVGKAPGTATVQVVQSVPKVTGEAMHTMADVMASAQETLDVQCAYFLRDDLIDILCRQARAGRKVRLLVPGAPDHQGYDLALKHQYAKMLAAGVEVWHWHGYNHGKIVVADRKRAWLGTGNPEVVFSAPRRSPSNAFDHALIIDDPETVRRMHKATCARDFTPERATRVLAAPRHSLWMTLKRYAYHHVFAWM